MKNYPLVREPFSLKLHNFQALERLFLLRLFVENIFFTSLPSIRWFLVFKFFQYSSYALRGSTWDCTFGGCGDWLTEWDWFTGKDAWCGSFIFGFVCCGWGCY